MQYLINLPLGLCGLPRPPAVDYESKLVRAELRVLDDRKAYFWVDAEDLKPLRKSLRKFRK